MPSGPRGWSGPTRVSRTHTARRATVQGQTECGVAEADLLPDDASALFTNERIVSVDLAGDSRPAPREIFQNLSFIFTLR
jgi:hypothetical protein